jgi:hypothetical protein
VRRRQFANRVPHHDGRAYTPGGEQPRERDLEGEQAGLGELGLVQQVGQRVPVGGGEDSSQRPREPAIELLTHVLQRGGEHGKAFG